MTKNRKQKHARRELAKRNGMTYQATLQKGAAPVTAPSEASVDKIRPESVTRSPASGASADWASARREGLGKQGMWVAAGNGIEAIGASEQQAIDAWRSAYARRTKIPLDLLDPSNPRRREIERLVRGIAIGGPAVVEVGFLPDGTDAYLRVYVERSGPPVTAAWLDVIDSIVASVTDPPPRTPEEVRISVHHSEVLGVTLRDAHRRELEHDLKLARVALAENDMETARSAAIDANCRARGLSSEPG